MNRLEFDASELSELCSALLDARLTTSQQARLQELLQRSEAARRAYIRFMGMSASLGELAEDQQWQRANAPESAVSGEGLKAMAPGWWGWFAPAIRRWTLATAAGVLVAAALIVWAPWRRQSTSPDAAAVAELTQTAGAKWAGSSPVQPGSALRPGWLKLESGAAQITFGDGARVILEGPAELRLISKAEGFCQTGRLSTRVPPAARGFKLGTPAITVTDLGTAFGLVVSDTRPTEVHVFEGQVEVRWPKATEPAQRLGAGQGLLIKAGLTKSLPARPKAFLSEAQFARRAGQPPIQPNPLK
jgi:hypothetical protein